MMQSILPTNLEQKAGMFKAYTKSITRIIPSTGQQTVKAGDTTIFSLPVGSIVNLKSFRLNFHGKTGGIKNHSVKFPKFMASMIERLEIFCNGQSIQNIPNYGTVYHIMRDFSKNYDKYAKKLSNNANPSMDKLLAADGTLTNQASNANADVLVVDSCHKDYCIDDWCGFLDSAHEFFNTNLVGSFEIHITWAPNEVLCGSGTAGYTRTYEISKLYGFIDVINFKTDDYIRELDRKISANGELAIPYKNYRTYLGATTTYNKNGVTRITESTQSLDKIMLTYLPSDRTTFAALNGAINNTNYYRRAGTGLGYDVDRNATGTIQFEINSQDVSNPLSLVEAYEETLKAFELDRENTKTTNPLMTDIVDWENNFFVAALSTSHLNDIHEDKTVISGIDTNATSLNLAIKTQNGKANHANQAATPLVINEMTSVLRIGAGRAVSVVF